MTIPTDHLAGIRAVSDERSMQQAEQLGTAKALVTQLLESPDNPTLRQEALDWLIEARGLAAGAKVWTYRAIVGGPAGVTERVPATVEAVRFDQAGTPVVDVTTGDGETLTVRVGSTYRHIDVPTTTSHSDARPATHDEHAAVAMLDTADDQGAGR